MRFVVKLLFLIIPFFAVASSDSLNDAMNIASSGMESQSKRIKVIAQNIANATSTGTDPNKSPYQRKQILFHSTEDGKIETEEFVPQKPEYILRYEPKHPAANKDGYVKYPNVNIIVENIDAKEAQRSFEANLSSMDMSKSNLSKIIESMR